MSSKQLDLFGEVTISSLKDHYSDQVDFWVTDQCCMLKSGELVYSVYWNIPETRTILRSSLDPSHPESPSGLVKRTQDGERL